MIHTITPHPATHLFINNKLHKSYDRYSIVARWHSLAVPTLHRKIFVISFCNSKNTISNEYQFSKNL